MQLDKVYTKRVKVQITELSGRDSIDSVTVMVYDTTAKEVEKTLKEAISGKDKQ